MIQNSVIEANDTVTDPDMEISDIIRLVIDNVPFLHFDHMGNKVLLDTDCFTVSPLTGGITNKLYQVKYTKDSEIIFARCSSAVCGGNSGMGLLGSGVNINSGKNGVIHDKCNKNNNKVTLQKNPSIVVRIFGFKTEKIISREAEVFWQSKFIKTYASTGKALVYEFLDGYSPLDFKELGFDSSDISTVVNSNSTDIDESKSSSVSNNNNNNKSNNIIKKKLLNKKGKMIAEALARFHSTATEIASNSKLCGDYGNESLHTEKALRDWAMMAANGRDVRANITSEEDIKIYSELEFDSTDPAVESKLLKECELMLNLIEEYKDELPIGICHNDLLSANIMYLSDGGCDNGNCNDNDKTSRDDEDIPEDPPMLCTPNQGGFSSSTNIGQHSPSEVIQFIDFEYTRRNYLYFDIGNHFNEYPGFDYSEYDKYFPNRDECRQFIRYYIAASSAIEDSKRVTSDTVSIGNGESNKNTKVTMLKSNSDLEAHVERVVDLTMLFVLISHLTWATWAVIQSQHSSIDFNYMEYAKVRWIRYLMGKEEVLQRLARE